MSGRAAPARGPTDESLIALMAANPPPPDAAQGDRLPDAVQDIGAVWEAMRRAGAGRLPGFPERDTVVTVENFRDMHRIAVELQRGAVES